MAAADLGDEASACSLSGGRANGSRCLYRAETKAAMGRLDDDGSSFRIREFFGLVSTTLPADLRDARSSLVQPRVARQPRAMPRPAGSSAATAVKRIKAVTLTAMAPMIEKVICQVADGIAMRAMPCVAL